jgi:SAM-dependent methyltransferase
MPAPIAVVRMHTRLDSSLTSLNASIDRLNDGGKAPRQSLCRTRKGEFAMSGNAVVDADALRAEVRSKYREVAIDPHGTYHFHTGRGLAARLGYDEALVASLPDVAVESFAGVANPFSSRPLASGERVVDVGSGGGFDVFIAAHLVGPSGRVVGVDMTDEMLAKSRSTADALDMRQVEFRKGLAEALPVDDLWADVVISNGVINLCADKRAVFAEIHRVLRPGGVLQFADIANGQPVPAAAINNIDLWTA